jgi:glycosyltransferase involved in cell wall biosynthesis
MPDFYRSGDVLLMPSGTRGSGLSEEPFGYTALEAMACGVPVIAYRTGGLPELIEDGRTGLTVPAGDTGEMARAALRLADGDLRGQLARNARAAVEARFTSRHMAEQFAAVYRMARGKG